MVDGGTLKTGSPLQGAAVMATVLSHGRGDKVTIFKMQRRKHFQKHAGHRQNFTELRIDIDRGLRARARQDKKREHHGTQEGGRLVP